MLRLRAYEKLQNLVRAGIVKKTGKEYRGDAPALRAFLATAADLNAKFAAGIDARKPVPTPPAPVVKKSVPAVKAKAPAAKKKAPAPKAKAKAPAGKKIVARAKK